MHRCFEYTNLQTFSLSLSHAHTHTHERTHTHMHTHEHTHTYTEELTDDNRTEVDPMSGQLMIQDTVFADTGVYTCFAENAAGNDSQNNTIVIVGEWNTVSILSYCRTHFQYNLI